MIQVTLLTTNKELMGEYHHQCRTRVWVGLSGWVHFVSVSPTQLKVIYLRLASRTGGRLHFALIGIMRVGQFLHHLQTAETKTHPKVIYKLACALLNKI